MSKAFTRESDAPADEDEDDVSAPPIPSGAKNYLTPAGYARLRGELLGLLDDERPKIVEIVSWAAKNGDRSENGDYLYGKKRLREIDRRIRFLIRRLDRAEVVDPGVRRDDDGDRVYFGATVTVADAEGRERTVSIVGIDEIDTARGYISWISPMARALLKAREGDTVTVRTPAGPEELEVLAIRYEPLATGSSDAGDATGGAARG